MRLLAQIPGLSAVHGRPASDQKCGAVQSVGHEGCDSSVRSPQGMVTYKAVARGDRQEFGSCEPEQVLGDSS